MDRHGRTRTDTDAEGEGDNEKLCSGRGWWYQSGGVRVDMVGGRCVKMTVVMRIGGLLGEAMRVDRLEESRYEAAADVLARAFENDPLFRYLLRDAPDRRVRLRWMFGRWISVIGSLGSSYITDGGEGVALWIPPGNEHFVTLGRLVRAGFARIPFVFGLRNVPRLFRVEMDVAERRRRDLGEPQWQLDTIGVVPEAQRSGAGSVLIRHVLDIVDRDGYPCYVMTHNPENVPYYERFGFRVLSRSTVEEKGFFACSLRRDGAAKGTT